MHNRDYYAWISTIKGIYHDKIAKLEKTFGSMAGAYGADEKKLGQCAYLSEENIKNIVDGRKKFEPKKFYDNIEKDNVRFTSILDDNFPERLKMYQGCPYYLFYKGKLPEDNKPVVAMIGARACSNYGRVMAEKIGRELSNGGVQIISGMARGIDTYSMMGALAGKTEVYAVLGCGVDTCYPAENIELYNRVVENGGIISEYPMGTKPLAWHFPQRNRIISAMADRIAVIEAKEKSGSLITVEWALEQGKDIYAVPGRADDVLSLGCNRLIKVGAGILTDGSDILEDLNNEYKYIRNKNDLTEGKENTTKEKLLEKDFALVYSELSLEPKNIIDIINGTQIEYDKIANILLQLQLRGMVEQPVENFYTKKSV